MSITKKRALLAFVLTGSLLAGVWWYLTRQVLPGMMRQGNLSLLARAATAFEDYYADHHGWPDGPPMEVFHRLAGRSDEQLEEWRAAQARPADESDPPLETIRREQTISIKNYLRIYNVKAEGDELVDAWSNSIQFDLVEDGTRPATLTSIGPDGLHGTKDDQTVTLTMRPRRMTPAIASFDAASHRRREQEFKAAEQALRKAKREAAREAAAAARQAP
ncbi:MAG: hypothetical protein ACKV19_17840 [Verrucomicrobiales bacterium]